MMLRVPDDVVFREVAGEAILLHLQTGTYFGLDPVGSRMWHLLAEHGSTDPVVTTLLAEYDVPADQLRRDLDSLIQQLLAKGLLIADGQTAPHTR